MILAAVWKTECIRTRVKIGRAVMKLQQSRQEIMVAWTWVVVVDMVRIHLGDSLVAQWLRIRLPTQGTWV